MIALDDVLQLQQPLKDGGIRNVNFFNGRLLTSKDLTREQQARREADRRLGLSIGDGVAFGLDVVRDAKHDAPASPVLRVAAGLAINRLGQTLRLVDDTSVALSRKFSSGSTATTTCDCVFAACNPIADGVYVAGAGVYLLTIAPAQTSEGRAPTNGLDPGNVRCADDVTVDALQFRLHAINPLRYADLDVAAPRFRNLLAYRCFGTDARDQNGADPLRYDPAIYGLVDDLRAAGGALGDSDVPLAILYWTAKGLQFVDTWAVRRPVLAPDALVGLGFQARRRRLLEAMAMDEQFRRHLADLIDATAISDTLVATDHFRFLPPFGLVPLQTDPLRGVAEAVFFAGIVRPPGLGSAQPTPFIDARLLGALRDEASDRAPTDLTQGEFVWVYRPWQNTKARGDGQPVQLLLAFASGLAPDLAPARADMARFDFSNYSNCCGGS